MYPVYYSVYEGTLVVEQNYRSKRRPCQGSRNTHGKDKKIFLAWVRDFFLTRNFFFFFFCLTSKDFNIFNNTSTASWVVHITRTILTYYFCLYYSCFTIPDKRTTDPLCYTNQQADFDIFSYSHGVPTFVANLQCP